METNINTKHAAEKPKTKDGAGLAQEADNQPKLISSAVSRRGSQRNLNVVFLVTGAQPLLPVCTPWLLMVRVSLKQTQVS